jgi:hypothetical protein
MSPPRSVSAQLRGEQARDADGETPRLPERISVIFCNRELAGVALTHPLNPCRDLPSSSFTALSAHPERGRRGLGGGAPTAGATPALPCRSRPVTWA